VSFTYVSTASPEKAPQQSLHGEIYVQGGTFQMGSDNGFDNEKPVHSVTVFSLWMMKTEVTQRDYTALMEVNPSKFKGDDLPVEQVSWYDAVAYANKLSQQDGLSPCYRIDKSLPDLSNKSTHDVLKWSVSCDFLADGWRLPMEAE